MPGPGRLLPRNPAEGVAVFVAVVLAVGAVASAVEADAASPDDLTQQVDVAHEPPTSTEPDTPARMAPPSVSFLWRGPASTEARAPGSADQPDPGAERGSTEEAPGGSALHWLGETATFGAAPPPTPSPTATNETPATGTHTSPTGTPTSPRPAPTTGTPPATSTTGDLKQPDDSTPDDSTRDS